MNVFLFLHTILIEDLTSLFNWISLIRICFSDWIILMVMPMVGQGWISDWRRLSYCLMGISIRLSWIKDRIGQVRIRMRIFQVKISEGISTWISLVQYQVGIDCRLDSLFPMWNVWTAKAESWNSVMVMMAPMAVPVPMVMAVVSMIMVVSLWTVNVRLFRN